MAFLTKAAVDNAIDSLKPQIEKADIRTFTLLEKDLEETKRLEEQLLSKLNVKSIEELNKRLDNINITTSRIQTLYTSGLTQESIEQAFLNELIPIADEIKKEKILYDESFLEQAKKYLESVGSGENFQAWLSQDFSTKLNETLSFGKQIFSHQIDTNLFSGLSEKLLVSTLLKQLTNAQRERLIVLVNEYNTKNKKETGGRNWGYNEIFQLRSGADLYTSQTTTENSTTATVKINSTLRSQTDILRALAQFKESDFDKIPNGKELRRKLITRVRYLISNRVGTSDPLLQSIINEVFNPDGEYMIFQGGNSINHLRGLLGEIHGLYIFHALLGKKSLSMKEIGWNAQVRDAAGAQSHADIILRFSDESRFGIQIKNYNSLQRNIGFAKGDFATLVKYLPELGGLEQAIKEVYQMHHFNISYTYKNHTPVPGNNIIFSPTRSKIEELKNLADKVLAQCAAGLMYLQTSESIGIDPNGNTLMLVGGQRFISSAQILQDIYNDALNSGFSTASSWIDKPGEGTIIDYIKKNPYQDIKIKITSSYNFGGFRT